jgi:alpha-1,6-mannosyltransferase
MGKKKKQKIQSSQKEDKKENQVDPKQEKSVEKKSNVDNSESKINNGLLLNCNINMDIFDIAIFGYIIFHVLLNPYTKVEENFITNNMYDHLIYKHDIPSYDFHEFPGVIERSFIPSLIISALSYPLHFLFTELNDFSCIISLYITRIILGICVFFSIKYVKNTLKTNSQIFGKDTSECFSILFLVQFHYLFYSSRPLPNTFALCIANYAYAFWLKRKWHLTIQ